MKTKCQCTKDKTIKLESSIQVCNFCPLWKDECLNRENEARHLLTQRNARALLDGMDKQGRDTKRLRAVMNRLSKRNDND